MRTTCAGLFLVLIAACSGEAAPQLDIEPEITELLDTPRVRRTDPVIVRVRSARLTVDPTTQTLLVDVAFENAQRSTFDGANTNRRAWGIPRHKVELRVDGQLIPPDPIDEPGYLPQKIETGFGAESRIRGLLSYDLPSGWSPERMTLHVGSVQGLVQVPLLGPLTLDDDTPAIGFDILGSDLRPLDEAVLTYLDAEGSETTSKRVGLEPWLIPTWSSDEVRTFTFDAPGYSQQKLEFKPTDLQELEVIQLTRTPTFGDLTSGLAAVLPAEAYDRSFVDVAGASDLSDNPDQVAAWVRDHIEVASNVSVQRSVDTVVRERRGNPLERAETLKRLLDQMRTGQRVVCGDLEPDQAAMVFDIESTLARPDGAVGELIARTVDLAEQALPAARALLQSAPERPPTVRETFRLTPEWCWVQVNDQVGWRDLDLRPEALHDTPLPVIWRTSKSLRGQVWQFSLAVSAVYATDDPDFAETVEVATHNISLFDLANSALVLDFWPAPSEAGPPAQRAMVGVAQDTSYQTELGSDFSIEGLQRLILRASIRDPMDVATETIEISLWEQDRPDDVMGQLRAVLTTDDGITSPEILKKRASLTFAGNHVTPAVAAVVARHDLYSIVRRHAATQLQPAEPSILMTVLDAVDETHHRERFENLFPVAPARIQHRGTDDQIARAAVTDVAARAVIRAALAGDLDEVSSVAVPDEWVTDEEFTAARSRISRRVQTDLRRRVHAGGWAVIGTQDSWSYDVHRAALSSFSDQFRERATVRATPSEAPIGSPRRAHARWSRPLLCLDAPAWRYLLHEDNLKPTGCTDLDAVKQP